MANKKLSEQDELLVLTARDTFPVVRSAIDAPDPADRNPRASIGTISDYVRSRVITDQFKRITVQQARDLAQDESVEETVYYAFTRYSDDPAPVQLDSVQVRGADSKHFDLDNALLIPLDGSSPIPGSFSLDADGPGTFTPGSGGAQPWRYLGDPANNNIVRGVEGVGMSYGANLYNNVFGDEHANNTYGADHDSNTYGNYHTDNTYGDDHHSNTYGDDNYNNVYGDNIKECVFGHNLRWIQVGSNCLRVEVYNCGGTEGAPFVIPADTTDAVYRNNALVVDAGGAGGHVIQDNGTDKPAQPKLNFVGFTVADDEPNGRTTITAPASGPTTTDGLTEGSTNKYYTDARADARITAQKGAASGLTPLGADQKVPSIYLPDALLGQVTYKGTYLIAGNQITSADTTINNQALPTAGAGNVGWYFIVQDSGIINSKIFNVGDWLISNGAAGWDKVDNTDAVQSVAGRTGAVVLTAADVAETSTLKYFTEARVLATLVAGYVKSATNRAIAVGDNLLTVLGILEKKADDNTAAIATNTAAIEAVRTTVQTVAVTGNYQLTAADAGKILFCNSATAITVTLPVYTDTQLVGAVVSIKQTGAGQVTVVASYSTTLFNADGRTKTAKQGAVISLMKTGATAWDLDGYSA